MSKIKRLEYKFDPGAEPPVQPGLIPSLAESISVSIKEKAKADEHKKSLKAKLQGKIQMDKELREALESKSTDDLRTMKESEGLQEDLFYCNISIIISISSSLCKRT